MKRILKTQTVPVRRVDPYDELIRRFPIEYFALTSRLL